LFAKEADAQDYTGGSRHKFVSSKAPYNPANKLYTYVICLTGSL
jgi:hypothetical protein